MKNILAALFCLCVIAVGCAPGQAMLKRALIRSDKFDFSPGGTVSITGSPNGSIKLIGTNRNEVEIVADIEISAPTEADLTSIADVTGFVADKTNGRITITTAGTHNKLGPKAAWKKFPKNLVGLPFRVDYTISVPRYADLQIDGGKGDLEISGIEGNLRINFVDTRAKVEVVSGSVVATFGSGSADIAFGTKGWRGRPATIQMGNGDLTIALPSNASADVDASVLNAGKILNELPHMKPLDSKVPFTDRSVVARSGVGGTQLKFMIAQGNMRLIPLVPPF
jgi:hypothetical protein